MNEIWPALEASGIARSLRHSVWIYPLVNTGHILGVALLVGAIVPLDLRLLGLVKTIPWIPAWRLLSRTAAVGLVIAVLSGSLLFIARAADYVESNLFLAKMAVVVAGAINAAVGHLVIRHAIRSNGLPEHPPAAVRIGAGISISGWLTAVVLGRFIGYF